MVNAAGYVMKEEVVKALQEVGHGLIDAQKEDSYNVVEMINAVMNIPTTRPQSICVMLDKNASMPTRSHEDDAGFDLYAKEGGLLPAGKTIEIHTGVHMAIPHGYCGLVKSRSGLHMKYGVTTTGVVDAGYTGEIVVKWSSHENKPVYFSHGDRIAQLVLVPVLTPELVQVDELGTTERGAQGFGSTGK